MPATNTDFSIALRALRTQARAHGVDPDESFSMNRFLSHMAEVMAQQHAEARDTMNILNRKEQQK
jgi:hypothetical protein